MLHAYFSCLYEQCDTRERYGPWASCFVQHLSIFLKRKVIFLDNLFKLPAWIQYLNWCQGYDFKESFFFYDKYSWHNIYDTLDTYGRHLDGYTSINDLDSKLFSLTKLSKVFLHISHVFNISMVNTLGHSHKKSYGDRYRSKLTKTLQNHLFSFSAKFQK